jgi:tetratricopeptide (TPR) repeat protein
MGKAIMGFLHCTKLGTVIVIHICLLSSFILSNASIARAQELTPLSASSLQALAPEERGDLLMYHKQYQAAIEAYRSAEPSAIVWNKIGVAYHHLYAIDDALKAYQHALQIDPHYADALNNLGVAFFAQKQLKKSERLYKRAITLSPNTTAIRLNLAVVYFAEGKSQKGMNAYRAAFSIDPNVFSSQSPNIIPEPTSATERANSDYCAAALFAQAGMKDRALEFLHKAIAEGFKDYKRLMADKDFADLRNTEEYASLMKDEGYR